MSKHQRFDDVGLFWEDPYVARAKGQRILTVQPIPETSWRPPRDYPNLSSAKVLGLDIETYDPHLKEKGPGWARNDGHIVGVSIAVDPQNKWYFPIRHELQSEWNLPVENTMRWLTDTLSLPIPKVGANLLYDCGWLWWEGVTIAGQLFDVQVAQILIHEQSLVNLEYLGQLYLGEGKTSQELYDWCSLSYGGLANGTQRKNIYRAPLSLVGLYAEQDADLPLQIISKQWPILEKLQLLELFHMEMALFPLLYEMRKKGVRIDLQKSHEMDVQITAQLEQGYMDLSKLAGQNIDSVANSHALLDAVEACGVVLPRTKKGARSLTKDWMKAQDHPVLRKITELRGLVKVRDTFIRGYINKAHVNGRIHCQFHSMKDDSNGTISGRFSSSTPNLQNIPKRSALGKEMRKIFIPEEGARWRRYDQSQVEYRMLANHAVGQGSIEIRRLYNENPRIDFHDTTAGLVLNTTNIILERDPAKTVNFGITYGMGKDALLAGLKAFNKNITEAEVDALLKAYHAGVPFARATLYYYMDIAQKTGVVRTHLGRTTHFDLWEPAKWTAGAIALPLEKAVKYYGYNIQRAKTYKALNAVLQGGAADLMKKGMLMAYQSGLFHKLGFPHLTVHDELDFSDYGNSEQEWYELQWVLENAMPVSIPFVCDPEVGANWGDTTPIGE